MSNSTYKDNLFTYIHTICAYRSKDSTQEELGQKIICAHEVSEVDTLKGGVNNKPDRHCNKKTVTKQAG